MLKFNKISLYVYVLVTLNPCQLETIISLFDSSAELGTLFEVTENHSGTSECAGELKIVSGMT